MVERDFYIGKTSDTVRYATGQPMGLLSSWAVFALSHHAIIQFCAHLENVKSFRDYIVIGDDVAIFHRKVAMRYLEIMDSIGVSINLDKSIISSKDSSAAEIAKRIFLRGEEISPIPPDIATACKKDYKIVLQLVQLLCERSWLRVPDDAPGRYQLLERVIRP